jgi:hypothetical protein
VTRCYHRERGQGVSGPSLGGPGIRRDRCTATPTRAGPRGDQPRAGVGRAGDRDHGRAVRDAGDRNRRADGDGLECSRSRRAIEVVESHVVGQRGTFISTGWTWPAALDRARRTAHAYATRTVGDSVAEPTDPTASVCYAIQDARADANDSDAATWCGRDPRAEPAELGWWRCWRYRIDREPEPEADAEAHHQPDAQTHTEPHANADTDADPRREAPPEAVESRMPRIRSRHHGVEGQGLRDPRHGPSGQAREAQGQPRESVAGQSTGRPTGGAGAAGEPRFEATRPRLEASVARGSPPALGSRSPGANPGAGETEGAWRWPAW